MTEKKILRTLNEFFELHRLDPDEACELGAYLVDVCRKEDPAMTMAATIAAWLKPTECHSPRWWMLFRVARSGRNSQPLRLLCLRHTA
jgi:hypothetical protein